MYAMQVADDEIDIQCPKIISYGMDMYQNSDKFIMEEDVQIYDLTFINTFMCTKICPCKDVSTKNEWLDMTQDELKEWPKQLDLTGLEFNFEGSYTNYKQCIEEAIDPLDKLFDENQSEEYKSCIDYIEIAIENPFDIDQDELERCIEIIGESSIIEIDEEAFKLETIFYTAAKYLREQENF